ncbi:MAG TPA: M12 family metallo-peptidase [Thermoanaerobaculia bacterium]|nr:M12 family metallo-peptidase [Thermoanaerobaculia bacterium]
MVVAVPPRRLLPVHLLVSLLVLAVCASQAAAQKEPRPQFPPPQGAPPPKGPPPRPVLPPMAAAHAGDLAAIAGAARGLPMGGSMRLEGLLLEDGEPEEALTLERILVFTDDAEVVVHDATGGRDHFDPPDVAWLRGRLTTDPASHAYLAVPREGVPRGLVARAGRYYLLSAEGPDPGRGRGRLRGRRNELPGVPFDCRLDEAPEVREESSTLEASDPAAGFEAFLAPLVAGAPAHTARVAVETDWEFFQRFGSRAAATEYVGDLFAYISALYEREVGTSLEVVHLSLWDSSADPWTQTSASCGMYEFGRYWNRNRTGVERTLAHFLSGKPGNSGIAWLGVLCGDGFTIDHGGSCPGLTPQRDQYGGAYGFTGGISGSFDPAAPAIVWDLLGVAHEIGHNFDSPHTHCYGGLGGLSAPVDQCSSSQCGQPGCHCGTPILPCGAIGGACGTVMSYCHLLSGNVGNIAWTFGQGHPFGLAPGRVPERMRAHVAARAQSAPACLAPIAGPGTGCEDLLLAGMTVSSTSTYATCGTLTARNVRVTASGDVTLTAGRVVLGEGFAVVDGGELRVRTVP